MIEDGKGKFKLLQDMQLIQYPDNCPALKDNLKGMAINEKQDTVNSD